MKSELANWSDLRIFLAVMRHGSTLAASRALNIAQPTVARRIDVLEHDCGLHLFDRDTRGFHPTRAAATLRALAETVEAAVQAFETEARRLSRPKPIRITGFSTNFSETVVQIFGDFTEQNPEVDLEFVPTVRLLDLMAGEADIALRISPSPDHPDLIRRPISTAQFTLYGTPEYARRHGLPRSPEEMVHHTILAYLPQDGQAFTYDWICQHMPPDRIARVFREVTVAYAAIRAGHGLGLLNVRMNAPAERDGTLIRCFDPPKALDTPHRVLINPEAWRRPEIRAFCAFFVPRYKALFP